MTRPLADFSLLDPAVQSAPCPFYAAIHAQAPVYHVPELDAWMICGYDELYAVLRDPETYSSDIGDNYFQVQGEAGAALYKSILREQGWEHVRTLQRTDPPLHLRYRRLVDSVFNPVSVLALTPRIRDVANQLIDAFIARGECEFIAEFALPLPGIVIAEQLGLEASQLQTFKRWADALVSGATRPQDAAELRATAETEVQMQQFLAGVFADRRAEPRDDLISRLVNTRFDDDEQLSMAELQNLMHQLVSGGFDTTTNAIAHGLWLLLRYPEQMAKLRANPALLKNFIEESLRLESPVQGLMRRTTRAVTLGGTTIPAGAHVIVRYAAANQDPAKFPCPAEFDIERANAGQHLGFGRGPHMCVGRLLAKQELECAFTAVLARLDAITLARPLPQPAHHPNMLLHPLKELPIRFLAR